MILEDLTDYLSTQGHGTEGTDLFRHFLPNDPDAVVTMYETGGIGSVHAMSTGPGNAKVERPRVQIVARATTPDAARLKIGQILLDLDGLRETTINSVRYLWAEAVQSPFFLLRDDAQREIFACNFDFVKELSTE